MKPLTIVISFDVPYSSNTFLLPKELIRGVHYFEGGVLGANSRASDVGFMRGLAG